MKKRKAQKPSSSIGRRRKSRSLAAPERFEPRWLMDGAGPQLLADSFDIHANGDPQTLAVLANDIWASYSGPRRITSLSFPTAGGSAEIASDGLSVRYRPAPDFSGDDSFSYMVDGQYTAQVSVHVVSPLVGDAITVFPTGNPRQIDVLANDPFWQGYTGPRKITTVSGTQLGGLATIAADGRTISYALPDDASVLGQTDHFTYIVDGKYAADVAATLFNPLRYSYEEIPQGSGPVQIGPLDYSNFQAWPEYPGPRLVTKILPSNSAGSISIGADGRTISYQPAEDFTGVESFTYIIDGKFSSTVTFVVHAVANDDYYTIDENDPGTVLYLLENDVYDFSTLVSLRATLITSVTQGDHGGRVEIVNEGQSVRYLPAAGFVGEERFSYQSDSLYTAQVTLGVTRPVRDDNGWNLNATIVADSSNVALDVLANDFSAPGNHLITNLGATSQGGTIVISSDGQRVLYTPKPGFIGDEQFTYTVDGQYSATVHLSVASPARYFSVELEPIRGNTHLVASFNSWVGLGNYPGGTITAASILSGDGTVSISADGKAFLVRSDSFSALTISYQLDGKYTSQFYATFRSSRFLGPFSGVAEQNLASPLDVLVAAPWEYHDWWGNQGNLVTYQGARLITDAFGARHGTVTVSADGRSVVYQPNADYVGQDTFQYLVDGHEFGSATVQVMRRVRDDQFRVEASSDGNLLAVLLNDQLGGGYTGIGRITQVGAPAHGVASISADGRSISYTPGGGYTGVDNVTYTVDGHLRATVEITVAAPAEALYPHFESLAELENWLLDNALEQYAYLFGTPAYSLYYTLARDARVMSAESYGHSETNVQVEGVDEADLIEADDNYLYVVSGGKLVITRAGATPAVVSETAIDGSLIGIYLSGDRLTVISQSNGQWPGGVQPLWLPRVWGRGETTVSVFNVADRSHPALVQKTVVDGAHLDSRKIGNFVYLALNNHSFELPAPQIVGGTASNSSVIIDSYNGRYETRDEYTQRVREHFGELLDTVLPHFRSFGPDGQLVRSGVLLTPEEIGKPHDPSDRSLLSIVTIDTVADEPGIVSSTEILTDTGGRLYMSHDSIYMLQGGSSAEGQVTDISKFTLNELTGQVVPAAHGQVPGSILDQFSIDESADGYLRIATTVSNSFSDNWSGVAENDLWVLRQEGQQLELIGSLQNLAHGESIRSVRFMGNRVVITTFPTTQAGIDPVYSIDLSDPTQPRFVGALTLPGFNQYMQFIDDTHVLTVGVNAPSLAGPPWSAGMPMQVSLFDVSDFAHPRLLNQFTLARFSSSLAQLDHHAFGWFAEFGLLALPVSRSYARRQDLDGDGFQETTTWVNADEVQYFRIDTTAEGAGAVQPAGPIELSGHALRTAFIGDTLYAIAEGQIVASAVSDPGTPLGSVTWELPPPQVTPIDIWPIDLWRTRLFTPISIPISDVQVGMLPGTFGSAVGQLQSEPSAFDGQIAAARSDLANRFHVAPEAALLVSIEAPAGGQTTGAKLVFRLGEQNSLYRVTASGSVILESGEYQFQSQPQAVPTATPNLDVNRDGQIAPVDAVRIINDLLVHRGSHRAGDVVLRQVTPGKTFVGLDVNSDGRVSPKDAQLVINALLRQQSTRVSATPLATAASAAIAKPPATPETIPLTLASPMPIVDAMAPPTPETLLASVAPTWIAPPSASNQLQAKAGATNQHGTAFAADEDWLLGDESLTDSSIEP